MGDQAHRVVERLLGLEPAEAEELGAGRVRREHARDRGRAHVDALVELFGRGRRPEAGVDRAAHGDQVVEVVAAGALVDHRVAEVGVVLPADGAVQAQLLERLEGHVAVDGVALTLVVAGVGRGIAEERLGAALVIGERVPGLQLIGVDPRLGADGHGDRLGQADLERMGDVEVGGPFGGGEVAVVEGGRRVAEVLQGVGVGRAQHIDAVVVAAVGRGEVVGRALVVALEADGEGVVHLADVLHRREARRIEQAAGGGQRHVGQAVVLVGAAVLVADGAEAIDVDVVVDVVAGVVDRVAQLRLAVAGDVVDVGIAGEAGDLRIGGRDVGLGPVRQRGLGLVRRHRDVAVAGHVVAAVGLGREVDHPRVEVAAEAVALEFVLDGDVDEGVLDRGQADVGLQVGGQAALVDVVAALHADRAAVVGLLQDDVDHAGDGVGAVLGGRAVLQHFHVVDGRGRDVVEVGRRVAAERTAGDRHVGGAVAPFAVDHDQGVVGADAPQLERLVELGFVAAEGLGLQRRDVLGQGLDEVGLAHALEDVIAQHLHGRGAVDGFQAGGAGAGDDDRLDIAAGVLFRSGRLGETLGGGDGGQDKGAGPSKQYFHLEWSPLLASPQMRPPGHVLLRLQAQSGADKTEVERHPDFRNIHGALCSTHRGAARFHGA